MSQSTYWQGQELPDYRVGWLDGDGNPISFVSGWTFTFTLSQSGVVAYSQTSGITGAAAVPNVTVVFPAGWNDALPAGVYDARLRARQTSGSKDRDWPPLDTEPATVLIRAALT